MRQYPRTGDQFAGHHIERVLGHGPHGVVYAANHLELGRIVALKLLRPDISADARFTARFEDDVRAAAEAAHPNTAALFDVGKAKGFAYVSEGLVEGWDLQQLIEHQGPFAPGRVVSLVGQAAAALDAVGGRGVVHGDLTPRNLISAPPPTQVLPEHLVVVDFGFASLEVTAAKRDEKWARAYLSPERLAGGPATVAGDVYSLAAISWTCLTGRSYVPGVSPARARPDLPVSLDETFEAALADDPDARPRSCSELARLLGESLRETGPFFATPAAVPPHWSERSPTEPPPAPVADGERERRMGRVEWLALVAVVVVGLLGLKGLESVLGGPVASLPPEPGFGAPPAPRRPGGVPGPGPNAPARGVEFPDRLRTGITNIRGLLPSEVAGFDQITTQALQFECSAGIDDEVQATYERNGEIVVIALCLYPDDEGANADVVDTISNFGQDGLEVIARDRTLLGPDRRKVGQAVYMATPDNTLGFEELTTWSNGRISAIVWSQEVRDAGVTVEVMGALAF